jgi:electron transfer flavoprotein-quinone oxidoreductase
MTEFLESTPHFMDTYVNLLNEAALRYFTAHGIAKRDMERDILRLLTKKRSLIGVGQDMLKLLRGMRG